MTRIWSLAKLGKDRQSTFYYKLEEGDNTIGRSSTNKIVLSDPGVSGQHAVVSCSPDGVTILDLPASKNGLRVNGKMAAKNSPFTLQEGDQITIGIFVLELCPGQPSSPEDPRATSETDRISKSKGQETVIGNPLPAGEDRRYVALLDFCSLITEGQSSTEFRNKCLKLLLKAFYPCEVQLYSRNRQLENFHAEIGSKPSVKMANFLAQSFQSKRNVVIVRGVDIAKHQKDVGDYNYLVGPLRPSNSQTEESEDSSFPFLLLVRDSISPVFTLAQKSLFQTMCDLWVKAEAHITSVQAIQTQNNILKKKASSNGFVGSSLILVTLREEALLAAKTNITVLIKGETGSGKEVLARFIHENSQRKDGPLICVNCAAIPGSLIESTLFGHVKGAFTGADKNQKGRFEVAHGGTLFLDEIGDMPMEVQAKVLRVLESHTIDPVGATKPIPVDVRIISATHRNLNDMVSKGTFREDLLSRIAVEPLIVPPLREHPEDIDELAYMFLERFCTDNGIAEVRFDPSAIEAMKEFTWPHNVRGLRSLVERCAISATSSSIDATLVKKKLNDLKRV